MTMLKHKTKDEEDLSIYDSASLDINQILRAEPSGEAPGIWGPRVLVRREYFRKKRHFVAADDMVSISAVWIGETHSSASTTLLFSSGTHAAHDIDSLLDERLVPIPLKVQPIKLILKYAGRGEPVLQSDTVLVQFDDD